MYVIDEAHRLRNVYKQSNKVAQAIKQAVEPFQKVLLTATPLQNSLLELFGLVSIIDEYSRFEEFPRPIHPAREWRRFCRIEAATPAHLPTDTSSNT